MKDDALAPALIRLALLASAFLPGWAHASCEELVANARQRLGDCLRESGRSCTEEFAIVDALEAERRATGDCEFGLPPAPPPPEPAPTASPAKEARLDSTDGSEPFPIPWFDQDGMWLTLGPAFSSLGGPSSTGALSYRRGRHVVSALVFHHDEAGEGRHRHPRHWQTDIGVTYGRMVANEERAVAGHIGAGLSRGTRRGEFLRSRFHECQGLADFDLFGSDCEEYTKRFYEPDHFTEPALFGSLDLLLAGQRLEGAFWGLSISGAWTRVDAVAGVSLVIRVPALPRKGKGIGAAPTRTRILIDLTDGRSFVGKVISESADVIVLETDNGIRVEISVADIAKQARF